MRLKELREKAGLTQEELGSRIGKTKTAISNIESGRNGARLSTLNLIAQALGVEVQDILSEAKSNAEPGSHGSNAQLVGRWEDQEFIDLPFVTYTAYGSFAQNCLDPQPESFTTTRIIKMPGHDYKEAAVIEVKGNSMAPKYPERARFVIRPVSNGNWQHSQGVHAIALKSDMFIIKRITSNREGVLELTSDASGEKMEVTLSDINCMWKVGEAVYFPAED